MHEFKHPKYYKELRKLRNKSDQAISCVMTERRLTSDWSGPKPQATSYKQAVLDQYQMVRAPSVKLQAASLKLQATSLKPQATSVKLKATSIKLQDL